MAPRPVTTTSHPPPRWTWTATGSGPCPAGGELLARVATVNDVHFGEMVCGHVDGMDAWATFSVEPGEPPYPEIMNAGAVADIEAVGVDAVVVKGDLTSNGTEAEYDRFLQVYGDAFGERLLHVRGNHESYHSLPSPAWPTQERVLPGVVLAVLDTSRDRTVNGHLSAGQLEWLDELGSRADRPVLVFGHHPVWNPEEERRHDGTFGLVPDDTEALAEVLARRRTLRRLLRRPHPPEQGGAPPRSGPRALRRGVLCEGLPRQLGRVPRVTTAWSCRSTAGSPRPPLGVDRAHPGHVRRHLSRYARGRLADRCFAMDADGLAGEDRRHGASCQTPRPPGPGPPTPMPSRRSSPSWTASHRTSGAAPPSVTGPSGSWWPTPPVPSSRWRPTWTPRRRRWTSPAATAYFTAALDQPGIHAEVAGPSTGPGRRTGPASRDGPVGPGRRVLARVEATPDDAVLGTFVGGITLVDYLPSRVVELVVHTLDLTDVSGLPPVVGHPRGRRHARHAGPGGGGPAGHGGPGRLVRAMAGRAPLPGGYNVLG